MPDSEEKFESDAISATSVLLHLGPIYDCLVGALDILKATIPALTFKLWQPDTPHYLLAAGMASAGHNWPIYYLCWPTMHNRSKIRRSGRIAHWCYSG